MSNKKNINRLDINQWQSLLITFYTLTYKSNSPLQHVEDIAIANKKKFPNFFCWSKYKEHIDLRQVMRTMDKLKEDGFVTGSNTKMWSLTKEGFDLAEKMSTYELSSSAKKLRSNSDYYSKEIIRIVKSSSYIKYSNQEINNIENSEVKYLFRIDSYNSSAESINRNKQRLLIASKGNTEINDFINEMWDLLIKRKIIDKKEFHNG